MFALFGRPLSSREKLIQGVRFNAGLELLMKPIKHMSTMATQDFTPGLPDSDMALPLQLQAYAFFFQKDRGEHHQSPEAHNGLGTHQLILVQAQFFLAIAEEDFDVPTSSNV